VTTDQAFKKVINEARDLGYSYAEIMAFSPEIYEKINLMEDTSYEAIEQLIEEIL
jgi:hypothetical protein